MVIATKYFLRYNALANGGVKIVYGAINENTDLRKVFESIHNKQKEYNWLITNCVCYPDNPTTEEMLSKEFCWISGEDLTDLVAKENFLWIWAVLSAFDKTLELSEVLKHNLPYAEGYAGFWEKPLTMQHPLAKIKIVPWDSTLTLIFSNDKEIVKEVAIHIPLAELHSFPDNPFELRDSESMKKTAGNIKAYGVFIPALEQLREEDGCEPIAGHPQR